MQEFTQAEAYKRLLQIAENILASTKTDGDIIDKYNKLKSAMMAKVTIDPIGWQLSQTRKLLQSYKYVASSLIEAIGEFQGQIQVGMERQTYNKKVIGIVKEWELRLEQLKQGLAEEGNPKHKLIFKQQVSALTYYCSQLDAKLENMGLFIEVHRKMHQLICQASNNEIDKTSKEQQLTSQLQNLQYQVSQIRNSKRFLQQHQLAAQSYNDLKMWTNKLDNLLFKS